MASVARWGSECGPYGSAGEALGDPWRVLGILHVAALRRSKHLDGSSCSSNELASLSAVESDPDRNTLRQPHPVEGRIDIGKQGCAGAAIAIFNTRRNAFHASAQHMAAAHQPHVDKIVDVDARQLGFLAVGKRPG